MSLNESMLDHDEYALHILNDPTEFNEIDTSVLSKEGLLDKFKKRLNNPALTLFLATDKETHNIVGYFWIAEAVGAPFWYDKIYAESDTAIGINAFTFPEYRGKGIFPFLESNAIRYVCHHKGRKCFYGIVEASNESSLRSHKKIGFSIAGINYLTKFMGYNIISIINRSGVWEFHLVFRTHKGRSLDHII